MTEVWDWHILWKELLKRSILEHVPQMQGLACGQTDTTLGQRRTHLVKIKIPKPFGLANVVVRTEPPD